jgi:hypothetical protein
MAPSSPSFLDRLPRSRPSPLLPRHSPGSRGESGYDLDELEPRPTDGLLPTQTNEVYRRRARRGSDDRIPESPARSAADGLGSPARRPHHVLFSGPPPPIARSVLLTNPNPHSSSQSSNHSRHDSTRHQQRHQNVASSLLNIGSVLFDSQRSKETTGQQPPVDSIWRSLRQREKAIEDHLQSLLDMQTAALAGDLGPASGGSGEHDEYSETGSSTPTATFYSTASSQSKMARSLHIPTKSTPDGDVIPVRQPTKSKRPSIRTARKSLLRSMTDLADLKAEEDARVSSAISQRKMALTRLRKLAASQQTLQSELRALDEDGEEPLGKELKNLRLQRTSLSEEIKQLEERLVGLRNKRRWIDDKIDDVSNRREAGLSGYKGALREVEEDIDALVRRPSIRPLDRELWASPRGEGPEASDGFESSPGGEEFLSLIPERRTLDMARSWWEAEIAILESRHAEVDRDLEALEQGESVWGEVIDLVTRYEAGITDLMKGGSPSRKGKEKPLSADEITGLLLDQMSAVIGALEEKLKLAEDRHWNLLICAIGAELDAFKEAERLLRQGLSTDPPSPTIRESAGDADADAHSTATESPVFKPSLVRGRSILGDDGSDNEVPPDLLASLAPREDSSSMPSPAAPSPLSARIKRRDSDDSVPPEFLAEHSDAVD